MSTGAITKAYDIKVLGGQAAYDEFTRLNNLLIEIKKNMAGLKNEFSKIANAAALNSYKQALYDLKLKMKETEAAVKELQATEIAQAKILQEKAKETAIVEESAAKQSATAKVAAAKVATVAILAENKKQSDSSIAAAKVQTEAEKQAVQQTINSLKQLQLQRAQARANVGKNYAPGSYYDVKNQYNTQFEQFKKNVNLGDPAAIERETQALMKLKTQLDNVGRSLTKDGLLVGEYTSGIAQAFHKLGLGNLVKEQVTVAKTQLETLNTEFHRLATELNVIKQTGVGSLQAVERQLIENRQAAMQLDTQLQNVQGELRAMGGIGSQITGTISREFANLKQQFMGFVISYLGFQQIISGIQKSIAINYELSDTFADLKNRIHGTDEEVQQLVESLKQLDTRTSVVKLVGIAAIVAKKGIAKEEIVGITKAIDDLMLSLGTEIGDPKEAVATMVKLVNVYSEDKHVTADNINAIGGAIAKLTTTGVATGRFLIDFAERMGGIRGITGLTIDKVLGMGAALEELGQHSEVGASAMSQLVVKLFTDTQRYADITGMSLGDFRKMLHDDVVGALVLVAQKLKGNAGEMEHFFEGVEEMHTKGVRMVGVLGDIAANADYARKRMKTATDALATQGITADLAATKQHNFAASIDRVKKSFELAYTSPVVQATLMAVAAALSFIIGNIGVLIGLLTTYGVIWGIANNAMITAKLTTMATNAQMTIQRGITVLNTLWIKAYSAALLLLVDAEYSVMAATVSMYEVMAANPFGIVMVLLGLVVAAYTTYDAVVSRTTASLRDYARQLSIESQIQQKANDMVAEQISKLNILNRVLTSTTTSIDTKRKALDELAKQYPKYKDLVVDETNKVLGLKAAYDQVVASIRHVAEAKAAEALAGEKQKEVLKATSLRQRVEMETAIQSDGSKDKDPYIQLRGLSEDDMQMLFKVMEQIDPVLNLRQMSGDAFGFNSTAQKAISDELKKEEARRAKITAAYEKAAADKKGISISSSDDSEDVTQPGGGGDPEGRKLKEIRSDIKNTRRRLNDAIIGSQQAINLAKKLAGYQAELKAALGKVGPGHGTRLNVEEYEGIKLIDAGRDNQITLLKTAYLEHKKYNDLIIDNERTYNEQLQKIEEAALQKKVDLIKGSKPAEQRARAEYQLQLLESQQKYNNLYYKDDLDKLNGKRENDATGAKDVYDGVSNDPNSNDLDKATAKVAYYQLLQSQYMDFMANMDEEEQKYNKQSEKNGAERKRVLQQIEDNIASSLLDYRKTSIAKEYEDLKKQYDDNMRVIVTKKIGDTRATIADPDKTAIAKKQELEEQGRKFDDKALTENELNVDREIALNQHLYDSKLISAKEYADKVDELNDRLLQNAVARNNAELEAEQRKLEQARKIISGGIDVAQTIANEALQANKREEDANDKKQQKAMAWNEKLLNATVQSNQEKLTNEAALQQQRDQMEKNRAENDKKRALAQMAIDYAAAAFKILAANLGKGAIGWAEIAIEEGILTAGYAAKLAFMSGGSFGDGGEVPTGGGQFGGQAHSAGGTPFLFRGRAFEAEANELAIINKRSAQSNVPLSLTGTPRQIASALNAFGGGVNFAPGARASRFEMGGMLGGNIQPPVFAAYSRMYGGDVATGGNISKIYEMVMANTNASIESSMAIQSLTAHVHTIKAVVSGNDISSQQKEKSKALKIGTV